MKTIKFLSLSLLLLGVSSSESWACTDFQIRSTKGDVIGARSMEWAVDLQSRIVTHPRGEQITSFDPKKNPGLTWKAKYGYVGLDAAGLDAVVDGMNEKGLSFGELWFPEYTTYPAVSPDKFSSALDVSDLGRYVLGTCASVDEAKKAIAAATITAAGQPSFGGIPTAHVALHDAAGNSAVIEWVNGQTRIHDNPNGVLTNSPPFEWQVVNLKNYVNLSPEGAKPVVSPAGILTPAGQGSGMIGLPGDWTPPSRFVRTSAMLRYAHPVQSGAEAVNLARHVLNAVDIPRGDVRGAQGAETLADYTQWAVIKDLTNSKLYFRAYNNLNLKWIDLKSIDFSEGQPVKRMSIEQPDGLIDAAQTLK